MISKIYLVVDDLDKIYTEEYTREDARRVKRALDSALKERGVERKTKIAKLEFKEYVR